jgi:fermentation-respiration switch protein FrsA (DUF1100 family)
MDSRFKLCALMGANHNWGEMQRRRQSRQGDRPVPHYWDHVMWVFGSATIEEFMEWAPNMDLTGVVKNIRAPFLITHGGGDRQIPVDYAYESYDEAADSAKRTLYITKADEFEIEHCGADNGTILRDYIADWISETFGEMV